MADRLIDQGEPPLVLLERVPRIRALYANGQVVAWVVVLPDGDAVVVDTHGQLMAQTTVDRIQSRWRRYGGPRLVGITERPAEAQAA